MEKALRIAYDVAGEVIEVRSGVKEFKAGDKVVSQLGPFRRDGPGGLAEFGVAKENFTVHQPLDVSAAAGAGLPVAGITAYQALTQCAVKLDGSGPHTNIMVTAASGSVGHCAVQLAKLGNTMSRQLMGALNMDLMKGVGADEIIDYKTAEGAALTSPSGQKYDVVIHCAPYIPWSFFEHNLTRRGCGRCNS